MVWLHHTLQIPYTGTYCHSHWGLLDVPKSRLKHRRDSSCCDGTGRSLRSDLLPDCLHLFFAFTDRVWELSLSAIILSFDLIDLMSFECSACFFCFFFKCIYAMFLSIYWCSALVHYECAAEIKQDGKKTVISQNASQITNCMSCGLGALCKSLELPVSAIVTTPAWLCRLFLSVLSDACWHSEALSVCVKEGWVIDKAEQCQAGVFYQTHGC